MKKVLIALIIACMAVTAMVATAQAVEQSQSQSATAKAKSECETGPYGKCSTYSEASVTQEQRQKILAGNVGYYHRPVDTAIDATTASYVIAAAFLGIGASVALTKIK